MKVKNIMFSGFMAVVLAGVCGTASAAEMTGDALVVASKGYVDAKLGSVNSDLSGKITALEDANKEGGAVANAIADAKQAGTNAQGAVDTLAEKMDLTNADSDLSQALATKENTANKLESSQIDLLKADGKVNTDAMNALVGEDTKFPTVGAAVEIANAKAQQVLENVSEVSADLGTLTTTVGEHTASIQKLEGGEGVTGSVANAIKQSKDYADSLATNYDAAGSAETAETNAKNYADSLAGNYDAAGSAATAESNAKGYADGLVLAEKERAEAAEAKALSDANAYTDQKVAAEATRSDKYTDDKIGALPEKYSDVVTFVGDQITTLGNTLDNDIGTKIDTLEQSVKNEETRAKGEEARIEGLVTAEANRADAAEKANAQAIADEKSRAEGKEAELATAISNEKTRAEGIEQGLQNSIDAINDTASGIYAQAKEYTDAGLAKLYSNASDCITKSASKHCIMSAHADALGNPVYVWIDLTAPAE